MSLNHAFRFYTLFKEDSDFRKKCYACKSQTEWLLLMKNSGLAFTGDEFTEITTNMLFKCQTEEEALTVKQIEQAYNLLQR